MEQTDDELLQGFKDGKSEAVAAVVQTYYTPLLNYLIRLGCPRRDAEDLVQDCFIKAGKGMQSYQPRKDFRYWLFRIASNSYKDFVKKASNRRELLVNINKLDVVDQKKDTDPVDMIIQRDRENHVRQAIQNLPEVQRMSIILQYYHGFSVNEIAAIMNCPVGTVTSRIHYAIKQLRKILGGEMNQ
ncbi:MAG: RNA polymerase sigma factor [Syntrophomonas sp.]